MAEIKTFSLPDLGEGLPDAEIVEWHVAEGDQVLLDAPLVSMETAKAVVEVPSPYSGRVVHLYGEPGAVIETGAALIDVELDPSLPQRLDVQGADHQHASSSPPSRKPAETAIPATVLEQTDQGTVVGAMSTSNEVRSDSISSAGGVKAMPAVRALAKKLGVDLSQIRTHNADGIISMQEVKAAASNPEMLISRTESPPLKTSTARLDADPNPPVSGKPETLHGVRRNMARIMAAAHASVVPTSLCDDADIHAWTPDNDITTRLVRAIVRSCKAVPALNAWFDMDSNTRTLHTRVDLGIAVDTDEGLFVPVLRNADTLDTADIRSGINRLRTQVIDRSIAAAELKGYTISLSNFGMFAGRYATPIIVPPAVAIIAAGKSRNQLVPVLGDIETHRVIPLSLSFDHRAATGGEAARFLKALLDDLALPS